VSTAWTWRAITSMSRCGTADIPRWSIWRTWQRTTSTGWMIDWLRRAVIAFQYWLMHHEGELVDTVHAMLALQDAYTRSTLEEPPGREDIRVRMEIAADILKRAAR
jgi:hypothetical protein